MLFIIPWCKPLETDPSREICTYATLVKLFFAKYISWETCLCLLLLNLKILNTNWRVIRERYTFLISCLAVSSLPLTLNGMLNKKYMLKMVLLHPNLPIKARVTFKPCSFLISTLTYHASEKWYIYEYT